ncbi:MAG: hypothetical protein IMF09_01750 [Proteobacteria bacterium]|nr:hypothetical protein [Pseudomonadota bacterium]
MKLIIYLSLVLLLVSACSSMKQPDLQRLYSQSQNNAQPPVILIPGILGSKLRDKQSGDKVWYGNTLHLLFSNHENLALDFDPQTLKPKPDALESFAVTGRIAGQDFYGSIITTLREVAGYQKGILGQPQA